MSLGEFVSDDDPGEATITVLGSGIERPVYRLLTELFDEDAVTVREATTDAGTVPSDAILVERGDRDAGFAVSSFASLRDELLFVNSDIYVTGARGLDAVETPDVITHLDGIPFTVRGYPAARKEKLLLIQMSRHIEAMAWQAGEGRIATGFQHLSRLDEEQGTRRVYARLGGETAVDTHVYGLPDAHPSLPGVTVHGDTARELRRSWFVAYQSAHHPHEAAALVAVETDPHTWEGTWTYDSERVADTFDYLDRAYD